MIRESKDFLSLRDRYIKKKISITSNECFEEIPIPIVRGESGKAVEISYSFIDQVAKYFSDLKEYMDIPLYRLISKSVDESYEKFIKEELRSEDIKYLGMYISLYDADDKDLEDDLLDKDELIGKIKGIMVREVFLNNDYLKYYYREGKFEFDYETLPEYISKDGDELWDLCSKMNDLSKEFSYWGETMEYLDNRPKSRDECMKESLLYHYFPEDGIIEQAKEVLPSMVKAVGIVNKIANSPHWVLGFKMDYLKNMSEFDYHIFLDLLESILSDYKKAKYQFYNEK